MTSARKMIITDLVFSLVGALRRHFAFCLELATGTLLDGFSMSFSSSLVGSKIDLITLFEKLVVSPPVNKVRPQKKSGLRFKTCF